MSSVPELSLREQKILNYHVSKHENDTLPVLLDKCMNTIEWSDLPHTHLQAIATLRTLEDHGLIVRDGEQSRPTEAGITVMNRLKAMPHWPKSKFVGNKSNKSKKSTTTRKRRKK